MLRVRWSAASALLVALCTLGNTSLEACDWGCAGCAGYGYGGYGYGGYGYGGYGYGGYGYLAAAYAYNPYPAYAYYAPPAYYQPAYAYSAPAPYYGYAAPTYGAGGYAPGVYGASYYAPAYGRPYYLGARNSHAPTINGRAPTMLAAHNGRPPAIVAAAHNRRAPAIVAAGQYGMRASAPPAWLSKPPPVTTAATTSPQVKSLAKRPLGFSAIFGQPKPAMKNSEKNTERAIRKIPRPTLTASGMAPGIRHVDAATARQRVAQEAPNH
jgi:hypothetical protein